MDQNQAEFLVEIEELVERLVAELEKLRLYAAAESSPRKVRESIDHLFRSVHSIKGTAAIAGLDSVSSIAHEFEDALDALRTGRVDFNPGLLDIFMATADALSDCARGPASSHVTASPDHRLLEQLRAASRGLGSGLKAQTDLSLEGLLPEIWRSLRDPEIHRLRSAIEEGSRLFEVKAGFDLADFDQRFQLFKHQLAKHGEIVATSPSVDACNPEKITFRVLYASDQQREDLEAKVVEFPEVEFKVIANGVARKVKDQSHEANSNFAPVPSFANFVRADLETLDRLISATDELFRSSSSALDLALSQPENRAEQQAELQELNKRIRKQFRKVEHELIGLRMVTLGPTLQRAARAGRAAARLVEKEIDFHIVGDELRVDKLIAAAIADPLVHLVRNAVDHGIETAGERISAGKPGRGQVYIRAISEGSQTRIRVMDDGRGIDPVEIADAARRLGLEALVIPDTKGFDIDSSLRLIFRPGFTTLESASGVSGRGVGLDVVENAIEQVGGELRVATEPARGTAFEIRLPVTFGIIAANVVVSAGNRYCIPVDQTLGIDAIDVIDGSSGANQLPQVLMRDLLGEADEAHEAVNQMHLITCRFTDERPGHQLISKSVGIVVDRVEGPQEVLVRSLGSHAGRWYGIAGATELKDGTVALVLDLPRLLSGGAG